MTEGIATPGTPAYERILDSMVEREHEMDRGLTYPIWRQGTVASVNNVTPPSVEVYLNGYLDETVTCRFLNTYRPRVNDSVWIIQNGSNPVIVGTTTLPPAQKFFTAQVADEGYTSSFTYTYTMSGSDGPFIDNVWLYAGQEVMVQVSSQIYTNTTEAWGFMSFEMSGASSLTTFDNNAAIGQPKIHGANYFLDQ